MPINPSTGTPRSARGRVRQSGARGRRRGCGPPPRVGRPCPWRSSRSWRSTDASMSSTSGLATTPACRVTRNAAQDSICSAGNSAGRWASTSCSIGQDLDARASRLRSDPHEPGHDRGHSTDAKRRRPPSSRTPTARFIERLAGGGKALPGFGDQRHQHRQDPLREQPRRRLAGRRRSSSAQSHSSTPAAPSWALQPRERRRSVGRAGAAPADSRRRGRGPPGSAAPRSAGRTRRGTGRRRPAPAAAPGPASGRLRRARADDRRCRGCRRPRRGSSTTPRLASWPDEVQQEMQPATPETSPPNVTLR